MLPKLLEIIRNASLQRSRSINWISQAPLLFPRRPLNYNAPKLELPIIIIPSQPRVHLPTNHPIYPLSQTHHKLPPISPPHKAINPTTTDKKATKPIVAVPLLAALSFPGLGILLVAAPPRYQLPMSVSSPFCVSIAAFGPTFETSLRKLPKYEYRPTLSRRSKYSADMLKKLCVASRGWSLRAYSVIHWVTFGYLW